MTRHTKTRRKVSNATRKKISNALRGKHHPHRGHPESAATRRKISNSLKARHRKAATATSAKQSTKSKTYTVAKTSTTIRKGASATSYRSAYYVIRTHTPRRTTNALHPRRERHEAYYRLRAGRPRAINRRLHLRLGRPHTIRFWLHVYRHGRYWQSRGASDQMAMPRVIAGTKDSRLARSHRIK